MAWLLVTVCGWLLLVSVATYLVPYVFHSWLTTRPRDLTRVFPTAEWALVTGGSSGIGLALGRELLQLGINVVLVARDDPLLAPAAEALRWDFPDRQVRSVGVDLGDPSGAYMQAIEDATAELKVQLVFNNAGYIHVGLFVDDPLDAAIHIQEVNVVAGLRIAHVFANRMIAQDLPGGICFTSSASYCIPCPMSAMYGATKAFITSFATSLAAELRPHRIHVMVVNPSPTNTNFYGNSRGLSALLSAQKTAVSPTSVARSILSSMGRTVVKDLGYFTVLTRLMLKVLDFNLVAEVIGAGASLAGDYWKLKRDRSKSH